MKAIEDEWLQDEIQSRKLEKILPMFKKDCGRIYCNGNLCILRKSMSEVLQLAHDFNISGHFKFAKTLSRLSNFRWRHKSRDVRKYVQGCMKFQQFKDSNQKKSTDPESLELPKRIWGSISTEFIVELLYCRCLVAEAAHKGWWNRSLATPKKISWAE